MEKIKRHTKIDVGMEGPGVRAGFVIATSRYESRTEPTRTQDPWSLFIVVLTPFYSLVNQGKI